MVQIRNTITEDAEEYLNDSDDELHIKNRSQSERVIDYPGSEDVKFCSESLTNKVKSFK